MDAMLENSEKKWWKIYSNAMFFYVGYSGYYHILQTKKHIWGAGISVNILISLLQLYYFAQMYYFFLFIVTILSKTIGMFLRTRQLCRVFTYKKKYI